MFFTINVQIALVRASPIFQKIVQSDTICFTDLKELCYQLKKYKYYNATIIQIFVDLYSVYDPYRHIYIFSLEKNVNNPIEIQKNLSLILNTININSMINDQSLKMYSRILIKNLLMVLIYTYGACNNTNPIIISSYYSNKSFKQIIYDFYHNCYPIAANNEYVCCLINEFAYPLIEHINNNEYVHNNN